MALSPFRFWALPKGEIQMLYLHNSPRNLIDHRVAIHYNESRCGTCGQAVCGLEGRSRLTLHAPLMISSRVFNMPSNEAVKRIIRRLFPSAHERIEPPILPGTSGVRHRFSFLVKVNDKLCAVDIYDHVSEVEVLRSYIKMYDTHATGRIISETGISPIAWTLAAQYKLAMSTARDLDEG